MTARQKPADMIAAHVRVQKLSARQKEVLRLLAAGYNRTEIAEALGMKFHTTKAHTERLYAKLCAVNAAHAVAIGYERGILGGGS